MSTLANDPPKKAPPKTDPPPKKAPPRIEPARPPKRKNSATAVYDDVAEVRRRMAGNPRSRFGRWLDYALGAAVPLVVVVLLLDGGRWSA